MMENFYTPTVNPIILNVSEYYRTLLGYRKAGAIDMPDDKDWVLDDKAVDDIKSQRKIQAITDLRTIGMLTSQLNINYQDQETDPSCTAFGLAHALSHELTKQDRIERTVHGSELWKIQNLDYILGLLNLGKISPARHTKLKLYIMKGGTVLTNGDSLQHATHCVRKYGATIVQTQEKISAKTYRIPKKDVFTRMKDDDITIYTGSYVDTPMIDQNHFLKPVKNNSGHCYFGFDAKRLYDPTNIDGVSEDESFWDIVAMLNSWYRFGVSGTGVFYVDREDINALFSAYAVLPIRNFEL